MVDLVVGRAGAELGAGEGEVAGELADEGEDDDPAAEEGRAPEVLLRRPATLGGRRYLRHRRPKKVKGLRPNKRRVRAFDLLRKMPLGLSSGSVALRDDLCQAPGPAPDQPCGLPTNK